MLLLGLGEHPPYAVNVRICRSAFMAAGDRVAFRIGALQSESAATAGASHPLHQTGFEVKIAARVVWHFRKDISEIKCGRLSGFPNSLELDQEMVAYIVGGPDGSEAAVEAGHAAEEARGAADEAVEIERRKEPGQPLAA